MASIDEILAQGGLWLDALDYSEKLLADGKVPWLDTTACLAFLGKAQGLLNPSIQQLPLLPIIEAWLQSNTSTKEAMAERSRPLYPIKTLLADEGLRSHVSQLAQAQCAASRGVPVVLALAMPGELAKQAYLQAHGEVDADDFEPEDAEDTASYMADFLRIFADAGLAGVVLLSTEDVGDEDWEFCQPILNVAQHYRWHCGLSVAPGKSWTGTSAEGLGFAIVDVPLADTPSFVRGGEGSLRAWSIDSEAIPESVLAELESLRP